MTRTGIAEYPYSGTIKRVVQGKGDNPDTEILLYSGVMDVYLQTPEEGRTLQTSAYIVSIPLKQKCNGDWIVPQKGDKIEVVRYGETLYFTVDNAEPSQLNGVSIYAARNNW